MTWLTAEIAPGITYLELIWLAIGLLASGRLLKVLYRAAQDYALACDQGDVGEALAARIGLWLARCLAADALLFTSAVLPGLRPPGQPVSGVVLTYTIVALVGGFALLGVAGEILYRGRLLLQRHYRMHPSTDVAS